MSSSWVRLLVALLCASVTLFSSRGARAGDPYLRWYTIETPNFRIHFHGGLEQAAQRTANLAELIQRRLLPDLGYVPDDVTHILVTDITDSANGSASVVPYDAIRLFVSAPDDMSPLGDYDDWLTELITHEHAHILHIGNITGLPALVNAVLGKTVAPNQAQPRWILEGLAVAMESAHTSGGRVRSTQFGMYLRADVLEDRLAALDQMSNPLRRWPSGNVFYLYGGHFISWIHELYGPDVFAAVSRDYGNNIIPWGINRSIRRATGRTYLELYDGWKEHLRRKYAAQIADVERRGLREGVRLTHHGRGAASPRFVPAACRQGSREELVYLRDDGHETAGVYRLPLQERHTAAEDESTIVTRTAGRSVAFDASCGLVFDSTAPSQRRYFLSDLFRQPPGTRAPRGFEGSRRRLTVGRRARDPDVSADGRRIAYVTNHGGTTTLRIARFTASHELAEERRLVPSARYEQAFTPRFSPDGKRVAYSAWTAGGYRDIRIVEIDTGRLFQLMRDRSLDQQPVWSADANTLFFSSDRSGISNIYAYDFTTRTLKQVTNVKTGAFMPEPSPDGRTLFYVGYTADGFDLFSMPLDRRRWLDAPPAPSERPAPRSEPVARRWPVQTYDPLTTLRPRNYDLRYGPGTFGQSLTLTTGGSDIVGHHAFAASITVQTQEAEPHGGLDYVYRRLPFDVRTSLFRTAAPRTGFRFGDQAPIVTERLTGITSGISYAIPGEFQSQSVALSYSAIDFHSELPLRPGAAPESLVTREPHRGFLASFRLGYGYSNAEGSIWGISLEKGMTLGLSAEFAAEEWGSDSTLQMFTGRATGYIPMPWHPHHVLALAASAGAAAGTFPRRGLFFTGGFVEGSVDSVIDSFTSGLRQGAFVLRGYEPAQFIGSQFNLLNAEYRLPLAYVERGVSTLPVFLRTLSAAAFADFGGAYDQLDLDDPLESFHLGIGAELWLDVVVGYFVRSNLRLGIARGLDDEAPGLQTYLVVSSGF